MKNRLLRTVFLASVLVAGSLPAQVPQLISYQGRVVANGVNFDGSGQFKFALVNQAGTTTYWSNDGSSNSGGQPVNAISLPVAKGLYSVLLGDATLTNMTIVPATVFTHGNVHLRVWFNDGVNGFQHLVPDRRIAAVGYAMMADNVSDKAITTDKLAEGAVTSDKLAEAAVQSVHLAKGAAAENLGEGSIQSYHLEDGAVTSKKIAGGAVGEDQLSSGAAAANLASSGVAGVASGGIVLSSGDNQELVDAGYVKMGTAQLPAGAPAARWAHKAVWTGSEMLVWGGYATNDGNFRYLTDVGAYHPATAQWRSIASSSSPTGRRTHTAIWTGTEMIVWGGYKGPWGSETFSNDGGRFLPTTGEWTPISSGGTLDARDQHSAIWTGSSMIVWGGQTSTGVTNTGALYAPATNIWTNTNPSGAPAERTKHAVVWTGTEMIVWGGVSSGGSPLNTGGRYNPQTNTWVSMNTSGAPSPRYFCPVVWTGSEMIVWGGTAGSGIPVGDGARYNPANDTWTPMAISGAPSARASHLAVWTGAEMIVWGGYGYANGEVTHPSDGARYQPVSNSWTTMSTNGSYSARAEETGVWTGDEMVLWGGGYESLIYNDGARYKPATNSWLMIPSSLPMSLYQRP